MCRAVMSCTLSCWLVHCLCKGHCLHKVWSFTLFWKPHRLITWPSIPWEFFGLLKGPLQQASCCCLWCVFTWHVAELCLHRAQTKQFVQRQAPASGRLVWLLNRIIFISNGISLHAENKCLQWFLAEPHRCLPVPLPWFNISKKHVTLAPGNISCCMIRLHATRAHVLFSWLLTTSSQCLGIILHCSPYRAILERKGKIDMSHWCRCSSVGHDFQQKMTKSLWSW